MQESDRYWDVVQVALKYGYMSLDEDDEFRPQEPVPAYQAEAAIVRWLEDKYSSADWSLLKTLRATDWEPNDGWKTGRPGLPALRRRRRVSWSCATTTPPARTSTRPSPCEAIDRAEVAYMFERAFAVGGDWQLYGLADYKKVAVPGAERPAEGGRRASPSSTSATRTCGPASTRRKKSPYGYPGRRRLRLLGLRLLRHEDALRLPDHRQRTGRPRHGGARQAAHHAQATCSPATSSSSARRVPSPTCRPSTTPVCTWGTAGSSTPPDRVTGSRWPPSTPRSYYKKYFAWGRRLLTPEELLPEPASRD